MKQNTYDAIVVGTGPAGATVARELAVRGKRVLILEWGPHSPIRGTVVQAGLNTCMPGRSLKFTPDWAAVFRGIISGGSTIYYYGTAFAPPEEMFLKHGIDLSREIAEIRAELPTQPLADSLIGPMAKRIMASARELGFDWNKLPKFIYQDKCKSDCWRCTYGCPHDAKWSGRLYVNQALKNGAEIIDHAQVKRILFEGKTATGVEYTRFGKTVTVEAPRIIVAAGGLGTPKILQNSGFDRVGRDFFFDPLIAVMGAVPGMKGGREIPMATGAHMDNEGYLMTDMTMPATLFRLFNAEVFKFNKLLSHGKTLTIMIKAKDSLGGHLTRRGGVRKRVSEEDRTKLMDGFEKATSILRKAGAKDIYKSWYLAAHPGGTAKIGETVDSNLQTEFKHLYVCDCSVIPEAWGLPPTFSLIALGKRLANHLTTS